MRTFTFNLEPGDPNSRMFAWLWSGKSDDLSFTIESFADHKIDHRLDYGQDGTVSLHVLILGDWIWVPAGWYLILDYDGDLFVMRPEKFDEWFPYESYGNGMVMTGEN